MEFIVAIILNRPFGSIIHDVANKYDKLSVTDLRKLEKLCCKLKKSELDVTFLKNCQNFQVFPKFLAFNIPHSNSRENRVIRKRLLRNALHKRLSESKQSSRNLENEKSRIREMVSGLDWYILSKAIKKNEQKFIEKQILQHEKKLRNLTKNMSLPFKSHEIMNNLSNYRLARDEEELLKFGLNYGIPPLKISQTDIFTSFELLNSFLTSNLKDQHFSAPLLAELSHIAHSYSSSYRPSTQVLKKHRILKKLKANKDIIILKPDKGNSVVILNRNDYINKMSELLSDTEKFKRVNAVHGTSGKDITIYREGQLQRYLYSLKKFFPKDIYKEIYPTGSVPSRLYGLPKMHKISESTPFPPLRPIVSSVGAYNYKLAKYLTGLLQPCVPMDFSVKDTFSFVEEIQQTRYAENFMVSFDVVSLFTNVPLIESIDLAVDLISESEQVKLNKTQLKKLFLFATSQTHFLFNGVYYDQVDGVCMGSPLGPVLANLFMGIREKEWIESYSGPGLLYYKRYVDDIFCCFESVTLVQPFFDYLNSRNPNIKFTLEKEQNGILPFLDVKITKMANQRFETSTYYKPSNTGLLTNFTIFFSFSIQNRFDKNV